MLYITSNFHLKKRVLRKITCIIFASSILLGLMSTFDTVWYLQIKGPLNNWPMVQRHRKAIVSAACRKYNLTTPNVTFSDDIARRLFVEHNHKMIYCEVPKAGCSNWKRILIVLHMNLTGVDPENIAHDTVHFNSPVRTLFSYPREQWLPLLNRYTKVMFTRDPFERLVSAYRNKFLHTYKNDFYAKGVANVIRRKFRKEKNSTGSVTFLEFVQHVLSGNSMNNDIHWRPIHHLCDPCNIHYDILGKLSTIEEDSAQVLRIIRAPESLHFPNTQQYAGESLTDKEITNSYFTKLSNKYQQKIISHYQLDALLFDYPIYKTDKTSHKHQ